jgi:hypothetical protein
VGENTSFEEGKRIEVEGGRDICLLGVLKHEAPPLFKG